MDDRFPPTIAAARARIAAVRPADYARTRNALDGAVSGLSPYLTHGFVTLADVLAGVSARHVMRVQHRFVMELGWRAYFRHVWQHRASGILQSLRPGPLPDDAYARALPADIRHGRTGVPAIDQAVRTLHATGWLHNHARLWLASYVVHVRQVHWRTGADWLHGHLLDGDLASNHLSWQWVAGTGSIRPYLFNAENVARHAPAAWHSPGTVIDASYEALHALAHEPRGGAGDSSIEADFRDIVAARPAPGGRAAASTGPTRAAPPADDLFSDDAPVADPPVHASPPAWLGATAPDGAVVAGRDVWLVHSWSLGELPADLPSDTLVIGVLPADYHRAWPWSARRWHFVGRRMAELTPRVWHGDAAAIGAALQQARRVRSIDEPHLRPWLSGWARCEPAPQLFAEVERCCDSFSQWWARASRGLEQAADLLAAHEVPAR